MQINPLNHLGKIALGLFTAIVVFTGMGYNDSGVSTRVQQPMFGYNWITEEGYYFKLPLVSRDRSYDQIITVAVTTNEDICNTASVCISPDRAGIPFADTYRMQLEYQMRFRIPVIESGLDEQGILKAIGLEEMHGDVKSLENLRGNTLLPFAQTLVSDTANQMLATKVAQGGQNAFRTRLADQASNGMLVTTVQKVPVTAEIADTSSDRDASTTKMGQQFITQVVVHEDDKGLALRNPTSISAYGVTLVPNSIQIIKATPVGRLVTYIDNKQKNIALQIEQEETQKLQRQKAKTAQLKGATDLVTRTNQLNIEKAEAVIAAEKRNEEAALQAEKELIEANKVKDLAVVDKARELEISTANLGIQEANYKSTKFEAQAIKEKGLAEAQVAKAKLGAKNANKEIYLAELDVEKTRLMADALPKMQITGPSVVMGAGGNGTGMVQDLLSTSLAKGLLDPKSK